MPLGAHKAAIMGVAGVSTGDVVLLSSQTASDDASIDFTSGITSTYGEYIFGLYNIHPETDRANFGFQFNVAGQSGFNETVTSTAFRAYHYEDDTDAALQYLTSIDQAQGTAQQVCLIDLSSDADASGATKLHLFNPSSTTYVKHFYCRSHNNSDHPMPHDIFVGGYVNATGAVDEIQFKMSTGNMNGTIKMWGVK